MTAATVHSRYCPTCNKRANAQDKSFYCYCGDNSRRTAIAVNGADLKLQGQRRADLLSELLPDYEVREMSKPLEWGVFEDGQYRGGFCWHRPVWMRVVLSLEVRDDSKFFPIVMRDEVRQAINQVLEAV